MAAPFYRIDNVNILPFIAEEGLGWEENDIDSDDSGRTLDGNMDRALIARKEKHTITFKPLTLAESQTVLNAFRAVFVTVTTNIHPRLGGTASFSMYNSSRKAAVWTVDEDGNSVWKLDPFSLIER